ncbi:MAG: hypothetical protein ABI478_06450, partial [Propionivibrio sp.]
GAPDLPALKAMIRSHTQAQDGGIHTGEKPVPTSVTGAPIVSKLSDAGIMILGERSGIETQAREVIMKPDDFVAEVDASWRPYSGDRIKAGNFIARTTALADARGELGRAGTDAGGVIVENPVGLFHAFKTSLVRDENVMQGEIDTSDSAGGKLAQPQQFHSAWLQLRSRAKTGSFFQVY